MGTKKKKCNWCIINIQELQIKFVVRLAVYQCQNRTRVKGYIVVMCILSGRTNSNKREYMLQAGVEGCLYT